METVLRIFIVEDSSSMNNAIKKHILKEFKNRVDIYQFGSVEEALEHKALVPDVMLLDHFLQQANGIDSIPTILKNFENLTIAVISGQDNLEVFTRAYTNGAVDYIRKNALFFHQITDFLNSHLEKGHVVL